MYGYAEGKEIALYRRAVGQLAQLDSLRRALEAALQNGSDLADCTARLLLQIRSIRGTLPVDAGVWESRPYDLLTVQSGDGCVSAGNVETSRPFERARDWEKLLAFFAFEDQFRRTLDARAERIRRSRKWEKKKQDDFLPDALAGLTQEDLAVFLGDALRSLERALSRIDPVPPHRRKYDIFDNAISYTERIARWQEYAVPGSDDIICIPDAFCRKYGSLPGPRGESAGTPCFFELLMFTTMFFRHLQRIGVTQDMLAGDYWHIPGGMRGLGAYQRSCTPETFFARVQKSIDCFDAASADPPVRLIALNGEWMASMDPEVFKAFSDACAAYSRLGSDAAGCAAEAPQGEAEAPAACDGQSPFALYLDALFPRPTRAEIRKYDGFLALRSDGGLAPAFTLSEAFGPSRPVSEARPAVCQMLLDHSWHKQDEAEWNRFWIIAENWLRTTAARMLEQKTGKKSITLNWTRNANSLGVRSSQLVLGYLCRLEAQDLSFDIAEKADDARTAGFCKTANRLLKNDSGARFDAYYDDITNKQLRASLLLSVSRKDDSTHRVGIRLLCKPARERKPAAPEMDAISEAAVRPLLEDFFAHRLTDRTPEELNALFFTAWNLWREQPPRFAMDPGSQLLARKATLREELWSFCETVLLWHAAGNGSLSGKSCAFPEKPFAQRAQVRAFSLFCRRLSWQWFGWKLNAIDSAAVPAQLRLSRRTKTPGLCENDESALSLVLESGGAADCPDAELLQSLFVRGLRCLLHKSLFTRDPEAAFAPARRPDKTQESRNLYFLGSALLYFGLGEGSYTCSWDAGRNALLVFDDGALRMLSFAGSAAHSAEGFARYLGTEGAARSGKAYSLRCTASREREDEFTLSIAPSRTAGR